MLKLRYTVFTPDTEERCVLDPGFWVNILGLRLDTQNFTNFNLDLKKHNEKRDKQFLSL